MEVLVGETVLPVLQQTRQSCPRRLHPAPPMIMTLPPLELFTSLGPVLFTMIVPLLRLFTTLLPMHTPGKLRSF